MSLKFVHQIIIFAGISISLIFGWFSLTDPSMTGMWRWLGCGGSILAVIGLIAYEIYFLKKTRRLIIQ
jgi:hypothetical protein